MRIPINFYVILFNRDKSEVPGSPADSSDGYRTSVRAIRSWHAPGSPSLVRAILFDSAVILFDSDEKSNEFEFLEVNQVCKEVSSKLPMRKHLMILICIRLRNL